MVSKATCTTTGIKRKAPDEGHYTLGFDGTSIAHEKVMTDKTVLYGEAIAHITLQRGGSGVAYNSFYMPSLAYGVPATSSMIEECTDFQKPVVNAFFPKMGINCKAARAVVSAASKYGGLELDHLAAV
jgi:hypothetical protein